MAETPIKNESIFLSVASEEYRIDISGNILLVKDAISGFFGRLRAGLMANQSVVDGGKIYGVSFTTKDNDVEVAISSGGGEFNEDDMLDVFLGWVNENLDISEEVSYQKVQYSEPSNTPALKESEVILVEKIYLSTKFQDKDRVKESGAKYDSEKKQWYAKQGTPLEKVQEWIPKDIQAKTELSEPHAEKLVDKTFLLVDYEEKETAKRMGAEWDKEQKLWFASVGTPIDNIRGFLLENKEMDFARTMNADGETKDVYDLHSEMSILGIDSSGHSLLFDGRWRRLPIIGKNSRNTSGAYRGVLGGNGGHIVTFKNHITEASKTWFEKSYAQDKISEAQKNMIREIGKVRSAQRDYVELKEQTRTAFVINSEFERAKPADSQHPYLVRKQVDAYDLKQDWRGSLMIPFRDIDGKLWSVQRIWENEQSQGKIIGRVPTKREEENGITYSAKKKECMYLIGGEHSLLEKMNPVILVEGFATGASINKALGVPVIMTIDKGNLKTVASLIREKYPNKLLIIAGDNDIKRELEGKVNEGKKSALQIVEDLKELVYTMLPELNEAEVALEYSDWNDLAISRGLDEVKTLFLDGLKEYKENEKHQKKSVTVSESEDAVVEKTIEKNAVMREQNKEQKETQHGKHP